MLFGALHACLSFDVSSVDGARVAARLGRLAVRSFAHAPLPAGALRPGAAEANVVDAEALQQALRQIAAALDFAPQTPVRLVLPHGLARVVLLDEPVGVASDDFALFRLGPGLPYAAEEAVVGTLPAGPRRSVAAAVRRGVAAEYESAVRAAGLVPAGVFLAPFVALSDLLRRPPESDAVAVLLGDAALTFAAFRDGRLALVRSRRRDGGDDEPERLVAEAQRTARAAELGDPLRLVLHGVGARALTNALGLAGHLVEAGRPSVAELPEETAEWAWLGVAA